MQLNQNIQAGFTLIEFMIVIAIATVLITVAIPKLLATSNNTRVAATTAIASALSATNASNYVTRKIHNELGIAIENCTDVANAMLGSVPANYTISSHSTRVDRSVACTISGPNTTKEIFTATGIN